ncbi:MAG TPA: hypothetical protein VEG39_05250 [Clostridia bacterium]|nr:hypothetical protein [Clostridia bacterium]
MNMTGCTSKAASDEKYTSLDTGRNVIMINDDAFKEAEKLKDEEIRNSISKVVYIAKFGFKEYISARLSEIKEDGKLSYYLIRFEGTYNKCYTIVFKDGKLQLLDIPKYYYEVSHMEPLFEAIDESRIKDYMDYATTGWYIRDREFHQDPYTVIGHEVTGREKGQRELIVYTQEGDKYIFKENNGSRDWEYEIDSFDVEEYIAEKDKPSVAPEQLSGIIAAASSGTVLKYKEGKINEDDVVDYIVLVRDSEDSYTGRVLIIDGKSGDIIADTEVIIGNEIAELDVWDMASANTSFIYFFTHDGQPYNYLLHYVNNKLVNMFDDLDITRYASYDAQKGRLNLYFTPISRTIGFPVDAYADARGSGTDLVYTADTVKGINEGGQLEIMSYLIFTPSGENEIGELIHKYEWENEKWNLTAVEAQAYNGQLAESDSAEAGSGTAAGGWFRSGVLTVEKDNLNEIFSLKLDDVLRMYGEPEFREGDYSLLYDSVQFTFAYGGKLGGIMFGSGDNAIFGTKIGMTSQQIIAAMGKPEDESLDSEGYEGVERVLFYNISGHEVLVGITGDHSVWCIVKGIF